MPTPEEALEEIRKAVKEFYPDPMRIEENSLVFPLSRLRLVYQPLFSAPLPPLPVFSFKPPSVETTLRIWEDHWVYHRSIVEARLRARLGSNHRLYARNTRAIVLDGQTARDFLDTYHLLGGTVAKHKYGLIDKAGKVLAVMTFSKSRAIWREGKTYESYELIRHGNLPGLSIAGGLSKLMCTFIRDQKPDDIVTYVSREWKTGNPYPQLGFEAVEPTPAFWLYVNPENGKRLPAHRIPAGVQDWKAAYHPGNVKYLKKLV